jgi:probable rRNA maturation factor
MKKQPPYLYVNFQSTVKQTSFEKSQLKLWLSMASEVVRYLIKKKIIATANISEIHVSLLLCGNDRIKNLNNEFRRIDKVTDVLSFPAHEDMRKKKYSEKILFLGDLAICHPQTKKQAKQFEVTYFDEFIHLFFHGMIHLMGYDHEISIKEEKLMQRWEDLAITKFSQIKTKTS